MVTQLDLLRAARQRLDDFGGDTAQGRWQTDDTGCLWKNAELCGYLDEAVTEFARRVPSWMAGDVAIATIDTEPDVDLYPLGDSVQSLSRVEYSELGDDGEMSEPSKLTKGYRDRLCRPDRSGPVRRYVQEFDPHALRLYGTPKAPGALSLFGIALPDPLPAWTDAASAAAVTISLPYRRAMSLIHWIEHLAFMKRDSDTYDPQHADRAALRFTAEVGPSIPAVDEEWRLRNDDADTQVTGYFY